MDDRTGGAAGARGGVAGAAGGAAVGAGDPAGGAGAPLTWPTAMPRRGTAVLLHGMMSLGATWWQVGPELAARGWDVRALDLAGHGTSPPLGGPLTVDALVAKVVADLDGPVDLLVGHSLGARTALHAVDRHPGLARAVVLEEPPGGDLGPAEELARGVELDSELVRTDRDRLLRRSAKDHPSWAPPDVEYDVEGIVRAQAASVAAGLRGGLRDADLRPLVAAAPVPVLVIAATPTGRRFGDGPGGSALAEPTRAAVRAALPAEHFVELPGGHCLHRDVPDRWLAAVTAFADEVLPSTAPAP
jgi:pimeloyl-ACP methyl ester carboxylesterase